MGSLAQSSLSGRFLCILEIHLAYLVPRVTILGMFTENQSVVSWLTL